MLFLFCFRLEELRVDRNVLTSLPGREDAFPKLRSLTASHNQISSLPAFLQRKKSVRSSSHLVSWVFNKVNKFLSIVIVLYCQCFNVKWSKVVLYEAPISELYLLRDLIFTVYISYLHSWHISNLFTSNVTTLFFD